MHSVSLHRRSSLNLIFANYSHTLYFLRRALEIRGGGLHLAKQTYVSFVV